MKKHLIFIVLFLFHLSTFAITPYSATYSAQIDTMLGLKIKIGTENRTLSTTDNGYLYQSVTKTNNKGGLLYKNIEFIAKSIFIKDASNITPISYQEKNIENNEIQKDVNIQLKDKEFDPLSLFIALPSVIKNNPTKTNFNFVVNNGKKTETYHYQIKTNNKNYVSVVEENQKIEIKFSKKMNYFPTLFKIKNISFEFEKFN